VKPQKSLPTDQQDLDMCISIFDYDKKPEKLTIKKNNLVVQDRTMPFSKCVKADRCK
jgi:hypothetical protein